MNAYPSSMQALEGMTEQEEKLVIAVRKMVAEAKDKALAGQGKVTVDFNRGGITGITVGVEQRIK